MKFIDGVHLDCLEAYSKPFLRYVGRVLGEMSSILKSYPHQVSSDFMFSYDVDFVKGCMNKGNEAVIRHFSRNYEEVVLPSLAKIPKVVIHGDFHPENILVDAETQKIIGIIDFAACGQSHCGYDLGIIMCHLLAEKQKCRFEDIGELLVGFCEVH